MEKTAFVRDLTPGDTVRDVFLVAAAEKATARNGPYWKVVFQDNSGRIEGVIWSPLSERFPALAPGTFAEARGQISSFKDRPQFRVEDMELLPGNNGLDLSLFLPRSKETPEDMLEAVEDLVTEHTKHAPLKSLVRTILRDEDVRAKILTATGGKTVHHAYVGGLLEHTLSVARLCMSTCDVHPELDRQILLAGAVLHDIGKAWELTGDLENGYTDEGQLLGHIQLGLEIILPFLARAKKLDDAVKLHLKHLLTSHHGEHEFGSPVRPKTPEAVTLHFMDNLDSKLNIASGALNALTPDQSWTPYVRWMERAFHNAPPTPDGPEKSRDDGPENQCLLPLKA